MRAPTLFYPMVGPRPLRKKGQTAATIDPRKVNEPSAVDDSTVAVTTNTNSLDEIHQLTENEDAAFKSSHDRHLPCDENGPRVLSSSDSTVCEPRVLEKGHQGEEVYGLSTTGKVNGNTVPSKGVDMMDHGSFTEKADISPTPSAPPPKVTIDSEQDPFLVTMRGREERLSPHYWGVGYRWTLTILSGVLTFNAAFASSAPSNLVPAIRKQFHAGQELGVLQISIFVAGYVAGPILWGPLSERVGRRLVFIIAFLPYTLLNIGAALAPNIGALTVFRFLTGAFGSCPLSNSGALIADIWGPDQRGNAMSVFTLAPNAAPALGPVISGFMAVTGTDWRWIFWVLTLFSGACLAIIVLFLPETYAPYILKQEAKRLRKETGDQRWHAALETGNETISEILKKTIFKPFIMLYQEPLLLLLSTYMSFVYGLLYLLFEAVPLILEGVHGLNPGVAALPFLGFMGGGMLCVLLNAFYYNKRYVRMQVELAPNPVPPEVRLEPLYWASLTLPVVFFWLGWGCGKNVSLASPTLALTLFGPTITANFTACVNVAVDTYLRNAASALSIMIIMRSTFGAGFPLFAGQMYGKLGIGGASSLLAGIACVFVPAPFLLMKYGRRIRMMSKNAINLDN